MDLTGLARDPTVAEQILADPLFHRRGTARLSTEVTGAISRVQAGAGSFEVPLLVLHGSDDRMVSPAGSRRFAAGAASADKQLSSIPAGITRCSRITGASRCSPTWPTGSRRGSDRLSRSLVPSATVKAW